MRCYHRQMTEVFFLYNMSQVNRRLFSQSNVEKFVPPRDLFVIDPQNLVRLKHIFTHKSRQIRNYPIVVCKYFMLALSKNGHLAISSYSQCSFGNILDKSMCFIKKLKISNTLFGKITLQSLIQMSCLESFSVSHRKCMHMTHLNSISKKHEQKQIPTNGQISRISRKMKLYFN